MSATSLSKPHDRFFKQIFSVPKHVESFLRGELSDEWLAQIDFSTLQLDTNNYMTEELQETFADVVYSLELSGTEIRVSFLFEHKSYVVDQPYEQLLAYMRKIWRQAANPEAGKLRIAVPMIVYHGEGKWRHRPFWEYFEGGEHPLLRRFIPDFEYLLTNLQVAGDQEIRNRYDHELLRTGFILMKHIRDKDLANRLHLILEELADYFQDPQKSGYLQSIFVYLYFGTKQKRETIVEKLSKLTEEWGLIEGSPAYEIYHEGVAAERERMTAEMEEIIEAQRKMEKKEFQSIRNMILEGFGFEKISKLLDVSIQRIEQVAASIGKA